MAKINHVHLYQPINNGNRKCISATIVEINIKTLIAAINLLTTSISSSNLSTNSPNLSATATGNVLTTTANNLSTPNNSDPATKLTGQQSPKAENHAAKLEIVDGRSRQWNSGTRNPQNPNFQNYLSLLIIPKDASPSNQESTQKQQTCTSNIPPATVTNDKSLDAIFLFELEEPSTTLLFSRAALKEKPITAMYTDVKIDGHYIKLILDSGHRVDRAVSTRIIMVDGATKTPISEIDDLPIKINGIIVPIKVLVMEVIQYQALVGNDWLSKTNATLNWNIQELQLSQNGKRKQTNKLTWETNNLTWTDNEQKEVSSWEWNKDKRKEKEKEEGTPPTATIYNSYTYHTPQ
ncbi:hypothetical protein G9A89_004823 [Geosiphon pyriformis]|nr:hypothetical protein G9A89_004823 [Geosiphon pyriformis]